MGQAREGIQLHTATYDQFACADEGTVTITNDFHSVAIYCLWEAGAGFQAIGTSGYNGTNIIAANYGSWAAGNTERPLNVSPRISNASGLIFSKRSSDFLITSATSLP